MRFIVKLLVSGLAVVLSAYILPGVVVNTFLTAILVAIVLAFVNSFIEPIVVILTLPINILTLGLFTLIIQALMVMLVDAIVPGFEVNGILNAILFSIVLSVVSAVMQGLVPSKANNR